MTNYYSLLGLDRTATKVQIKKNYRLLATKYHPDKSSDPGAPAKFIAITEAYDVLSNKKTRIQYDLLIWEKLKRKNASEAYDAPPPPRESTRMRRNKAQMKRGAVYQDMQDKSKKLSQLILESMRIVSRYYIHVLAVTLWIVILGSLTSQFLAVFDSGIGSGIFVCLIILGVIYGLAKTLQIAYEDLNKDLHAFSIFYKIPKSKATRFTLATFAIVIVLYAVLIRVSF